MNGRRSSWLVFMVLTRVVCYGVDSDHEGLWITRNFVTGYE